MKCSKCGADLLEGMKFCSECGTKVKIVNDSDTENANEILIEPEPEINTNLDNSYLTLEMMRNISQKNKSDSVSEIQTVYNETNFFPIISLVVLVVGTFCSWFIAIPFPTASQIYVVFGVSFFSGVISLILAIFGVRRGNYTFDKIVFSKIMMIISAGCIVVNLILGIIAFIDVEDDAPQVINATSVNENNSNSNEASYEDESLINQEQSSIQDSTINDASETTNENLNEGIKTITLNEPVINGGLDFTLTSSEWLDEIYPPVLDGVYAYFADEVDETYFVIHGNCKSNYGSSFSFISSFKTKLIFDGKYEYYGDAEVISADGTDMDSSIKPLQEGDFIIYYSVPDEVKDSNGLLTAKIVLGDGDHYIDSDGSNALGFYQIDLR